MAILVNKDTRLLVQGITGKDGSFHAKQMIDYGTNVVAGVTPGKGGQREHGVPVFNTVREAVAATGANTSIIYVPARLAPDAILEAAKEAGVDMTQWGPSDFSFSRGTPQLAETGEIRKFEELVIKKSIEHGVPPRIEIGQVEQAQRYVDLGVRHFCIGWDRFIIQETMARLGEGMRKVVEGI